jgi:hypothetical protein
VAQLTFLDDCKWCAVYLIQRLRKTSTAHHTMSVTISCKLMHTFCRTVLT